MLNRQDTEIAALAQICRQLDNQMALLTNNARTAIPRHQTMHSALMWSYRLLSAEEQSLLATATVFAGGWTLAAAQAICVDATSTSVTPTNVATLLNQLSAKSLVLAETLNGQQRFRFLELVRQFAAAEQFYAQALAIQRALTDIDHAGVTLTAMGRLAQRQGDYARARELLHESLAMAIKMGYRPSIADALEALAALTAAQGQAERAVLIFAAVDELLRKD